jgi:hypothetical protein
MLENTRQPPNGQRNARFNQRPTKSKLDALKAKSISKIPAIELKVLIILPKESF